ncbi:hypothetical protein ACA910_015992 [Epithemia clementina (nom. ined.)]
MANETADNPDSKHESNVDDKGKNEDEILEEWRRKRASRRRQQEQQDNRKGGMSDELLFHGTNDDEDDDDTLLLTTAKRRRVEREQLMKDRNGSKQSSLPNSSNSTSGRAEQSKQQEQSQQNQQTTDFSQPQKPAEDANAAAEDSSKLQHESQEQGEEIAREDAPAIANMDNVQSLMDQAETLHLQQLTPEERAERKRQHEETLLLKQAQAQLTKKALQSAKDVAQGIVYTKPMPSMWKVPRWMLDTTSPTDWQKWRKEYAINAEGKDIPTPMSRFVDMKLPPPILKMLQEKNITRPTPIQMQGIPAALAGRDLVGIAFTGSGKTLAFCLPTVMVSLEQELLMPLYPGEGPVCILMAPSRELARQTYDILTEYLQAVSNTPEYPTLNSLLLIGGEAMGAQVRALQETPIHCVVATAGRLRMLLKEQRMTLDNTRLVCLDEADRLLDLGFDEDLGDIFNYFSRQKQSLLFSATFPQKFQEFCRQTLVQPIVINVGRAGAANLDVIQEVEYVKQESKLVYLLSALQKTAPPVCIFSQRQRDVDDIHEYLLLKGVQAVSIHGSKDQQERNAAIQLFKSGQKDVLIATDVAAKGLDFPNIQHVINFDMPTEIENYVHRIGRTGRCGKTGVATTFINKSSDEMTLLDLRGLLKEARQRIPPVLELLQDPRPSSGNAADGAGGGGCSFCGGLGHSIVDCPKIEKDAKRIQRGNYDALQMGGGDW